MQKPWTPEDDRTMRALYPTTHNVDLGQLLGRTEPSISNRAVKLGLRKTAEYLQHSSTRFKPQQKPWNTGRKGYMAGGRSAETRFKPGRLPHESRNYLPIGSLRINRDGHLERKVTDNPALAPARRWQPVYRLVWEAAHGPIPKTHLVRFKPGQATAMLEHITLDRLECISKAEHAFRNHPARRDPQYAQLVQLKGAITRQVNRITRQHTTQAQP
jgi:hypothetical protein